jgi:CBS domain-containing protein
MRAYERLRRSAVGLTPDRTIQEAAAIMDSAGVGALAVLDDDRLVGIVTDRDLVRRGMAKGLERDARVDGVMSTPVVTIDAEADLHHAFALLSTHGIRRLAVVENDKFVGMITVDDLLVDLAQDLSALSRPVTAEIVFGHHDSPTPSVR